MQNRRFVVIAGAILALCASGCGSRSAAPPPAAGNQRVAFSNLPYHFDAPAKYVVRREAEDTIALQPRDGSAVTVRFNIHHVGTDSNRTAKQFIDFQAERKALTVEELGGKPSISEFKSRTEDGRVYDTTFFQIALEDSLVVMSIEVDKARGNDAEVQECVNALPKLVGSMRHQ